MNDGKVARRTLPLNALRAFEAVARMNSFTLGAESLSVTQSAVSRHVAMLEAILGKPLFDRMTRKIALSDAGHLLLPVVTRTLDSLEDVMNEIKGEHLLKLHIPPAFLQSVALSFIKEFRDQNPHILLDIRSGFETGASIDGLDIAIVVDKPRVDDNIRDLLWPIWVTPVCAPGAASAYQVRGLDNVLQSDDLLHVIIPGEGIGTLWHRFAQLIGARIAHERGMAFQTIALAVDYAEKGSGIALADTELFADRLREGRIVAPFGDKVDIGYGYYLKLNPNALSNPAVRQFRASIVARFGKNAVAITPAYDVAEPNSPIS